MRNVTRRRLLTLGAVTVLAGCSEGDDSPATTSDTGGTGSSQGSLPDDVAAVLAVVPSTVGDQTMTGLLLSTPVAGDRELSGVPEERVSADIFALDSDSLDRVGIAKYGDDRYTLLVAVGSFDADAPSYNRGNVSTNGIHREDGLYIVALDGTKSWAEGLQAATATEGFASDSSIERTLQPITDDDSIGVTVDYPPPGGLLAPPSGVNVAAISSLAMGIDRRQSERIDVTYVALFDSEDSVEEAVLRAIANDAYLPEGAELAFERSGQRLVASATAGLAAPN